MPDLFIHLGCPKTGSTAIQEYLYVNRAILAKRGVLYPRFSQDHSRHVEITRAISNALDAPSQHANSLEEFISDFKREISESGCDTVILSDEALYAYGQSFANLLISSIEKIFSRISVILYVRPQLELWSSHYAEICKHLHVLPRHPFWVGEDEKDAFQEAIPCKRGLRLTSVLDSYSRLIGIDNVIARMYDRSKFPGRDIVLDFLSLLDIDQTSLPSPATKDKNPSWGWKSIELSKYIASCYWDRFKQEPTLRRPVSLALHKTVYSTILSNKSDWLGTPPCYLTKEDQENLFSYYEKDNVTLQAKYLPDMNVQRPKPLPWISVSLYDIPPDELNYALTTLFDQSLPNFPSL